MDTHAQLASTDSLVETDKHERDFFDHIFKTSERVQGRVNESNTLWSALFCHSLLFATFEIVVVFISIEPFLIGQPNSDGAWSLGGSTCRYACAHRPSTLESSTTFFCQLLTPAPHICAAILPLRAEHRPGHPQFRHVFVRHEPCEFIMDQAEALLLEKGRHVNARLRSEARLVIGSSFTGITLFSLQFTPEGALNCLGPVHHDLVDR
eukprot:4844510-Prymnesium_polylepis.2